MGFFDGYDISVSGMTAQRTRINIVSTNIANAKTTHAQDGQAYKKRSVVFKDVLLQEKNKVNDGDNLDENRQENLRGVAVKSIIQDKDFIMKYEPSHPDANRDGYVAYPNINPVVEMVNLIEAMRSYEANVATFNTHKNIDIKTIDILKA